MIGIMGFFLGYFFRNYFIRTESRQVSDAILKDMYSHFFTGKKIPVAESFWARLNRKCGQADKCGYDEEE